MRFALPLLVVVFAGCDREPANPFEDALGPPPVETTTHTAVGVSVGSDGVDVGAAISQTRGNLTIGVGF